MIKRASLAYAAAALILFVSPQLARADLLPSLTGTTPGAGVTNFNYQVLVTQGERADGTGGIQAYFTIYDIGGFVSATAPANWTVSTQNQGLTPVGADNTTPIGVADNAALPNVTFSYTGANSIGQGTIIPGFIIASTFPGTIPTGQFSQQATKIVGLLGPVRDFGGGPLPVPFGQSEFVVPEPSAIALMLTGLVAIAVGARKTRQTK